MSKIDRLNAFHDVLMHIDKKVDRSDSIKDSMEKLGYLKALKDVTEWIHNNIDYYKYE